MLIFCNNKKHADLLYTKIEELFPNQFDVIHSNKSQNYRLNAMRSFEKQEVRGIEISANHLRSKREGMVYCTAKIVHKGASIHLWEIRIVDEKDKLISLCKLSNMVLSRRER